MEYLMSKVLKNQHGNRHVYSTELQSSDGSLLAGGIMIALGGVLSNKTPSLKNSLRAVF